MSFSRYPPMFSKELCGDRQVANSINAAAKSAVDSRRRGNNASRRVEYLADHSDISCVFHCPPSKQADAVVDVDLDTVT